MNSRSLLSMTTPTTPKVGTAWTPEGDLKRLHTILSTKRPHGGGGVDFILDNVLAPYEPETLVDDLGDALAYLVQVGEGSRTLFVAHLDTAESTDGQRELLLDEKGKLMSAQGILGADDGAGVWLLLEMIDNLVPGSYLFTEGEERGGIGAKGVAAFHGDFLADFDRAIAFDRRGTFSVITHQFSGRCCSNAFADALAGLLSSDSLMFGADNSGIYTDTAEFTEIIPECTNISAGYYSEHTTSETLDLKFLQDLRNQVIAMDWESLPTERDPKVVESKASQVDWWAVPNTKIVRDVDWYKIDPRDLDYAELYEWAENVDLDTIVNELYDALKRHDH